MPNEIMITSDEEGVGTDVVRIGVLGTGAIAQRLHLPGYVDHPNAEVTAVCDVEAEKARAVADEFGAQDHFTDYHAMVESGTVDAVSVCLPNHMHEESVTAALDHDLHVLCEKPMAMSVAEAERMTATADESEGVLMIDQSERFAPVYQKAIDLIESGLIGEVQTIRARFSHSGPEGWAPRSTWFTDADASGGGAMVDIGIHNADLVLSLVGDVDEVMAYTDTLASDAEVEDTAVANLRLGNGGLGTFEVSWTTDPEKIETQVVGTEGVLTVDKVAGTIAVDLSDERGRVEEIPLPEYRSPIARFVDAVVAGEDPPVTGEEGRDALELVMAIYRAADRREPVAIPLEEAGE